MVWRRNRVECRLSPSNPGDLMRSLTFVSSARSCRSALVASALAAIVGACPAVASAAADNTHTSPRDLLVSTSRYREADIQPGVTQLPPGCTSGCAAATADGAYPYVFNNDLVDPSFGVAAPIVLQRIGSGGRALDRTKVPTGQLVTSFSSKSE